MAKRKPDGRATRQPVALPAPAWKDNPVGKPRLLAFALIVIAGLLAYHNSFTGPFVFDDIASIEENPTIRHLWPIWQVFSPPREGGLTVGGRPLVNFSLAV